MSRSPGTRRARSPAHRLGNTRFSRSLAVGSFAVCVIHVPIVVALQFAVSGRGLPALAAFALVTARAVPVSFAAAHVLRRIPGIRRVLRTGRPSRVLQRRRRFERDEEREGRVQ